jgi:hypothetical protein
VITLLLKNFYPDNGHEYVFQILHFFASFCAQDLPLPLIPFVSRVKKKMDKSDWIKLKFLMDPDNTASKYSQKFAFFKDICLEKWIKWVMAFHDMEDLTRKKEPEYKTRMYVSDFVEGSSLVLS